jgi:hypothetical protein
MGNQIEVVMTGDESRLVRSFQHATAEQNKQEGALRKSKSAAADLGKQADNAGAALQRAGRQGSQSFDGLSMSIGASVSALNIAQQALERLATTAVQAIRRAREEDKKGGETLKESKDWRGRLNQVADSPQDYQAMLDKVNKLSEKHGLPRAKVADALFKARSSGYEDFLPQMLAASQTYDLDAQAKVATEIPTLFEGQRVGPIDAINMIAKASQKSKFTFEEMAAGMPTVAEGASLTGATAEESMAALGSLAQKYGGTTAAERLKAYTSKVGTSSDPRLKGKGIVESARIIQGRGQT